MTTMPPLLHSHTQHTLSLQWHPHMHHIVTPGFVDSPLRSDYTDGRVMGVGGQQQVEWSLSEKSLVNKFCCPIIQSD